ncbi:hypothetical protein CLV58_1063 [Spirosoma oryzae]|uniref:Uncharacterized protein n=2 Tax=Spirosoma oryzae TaxID=1469603 RepID=A0A2T0T572_9BACT|nr:hypothetical protein CLV58_1063 [Spirosoma oryzae]
MNNGRDGLLRMHWRKRNKLRDYYQLLFRTQTTNRHTGQVRIELVRHSTGQPADYDGLVSSGKLPFDAMKRAGIIVDDSPDYIGQPSYSQTKAINHKSQMTVIRIIDVDPTHAP